MTLWIVAGAIFVGVTALLIGLGSAFRDRQRTHELAERLDMFAGLKHVEADVPNLLREPIEAEQAVQGLLGRIGSPSGQLQNLIVTADVNIGMGTFLTICTAFAVVGALALTIVGASALLIPFGALFGVAPIVFLVFRRRQRLRMFAAQFPDALELMARALRAGHSLASGFQLVSQEMPVPIGKEFQRTYDEQNFGIPLEDSLKNLGDRVPNIDLGFFITAVIIQRQTGGDLAEILDKLSYVIRERFKLFGQVAALTAEGRLSGWILNALPFVVLLVLLKLNPSYVMLLFRDPMGVKMLTVAAIMQVLGAIAIRKIVNIRV